jgi:hypothetical protein
MYTDIAYFASPIDGNFYPTYVTLPSGQITSVHFIQTPEGFRLVYYPATYWGGTPTPIDITISLKNRLSNVVYYQPQGFGQTQLLYCNCHEPNALTLMCNNEFQKFLPIRIGDTGMLQQLNHSNSALPSTPFIEQQPNTVPVPQNINIPSDIYQGLQAVQEGRLANVSVKSNQHGYKLTAEDFEGNRIIIEKHSQNGINQSSETVVETTNLKTQRQDQVKQLRLDNMTQNEIANHLGVSQKTISNDIKELGIS